MTITLFSDTNCRGQSVVVEDDLRTLRGTNVGNNPRSLRMTNSSDALLLCNRTDWNGEVFYLRNRRTIRDLNDEAAGGTRGLGNSITSARVTPFRIPLNITVVTGANGELPGIWTSRDAAQQDISTILAAANDFYDSQHALITVSIHDVTFRADEKRFRISEAERDSIPSSWKVKNAVDIVFCHALEGAVGIGHFPGTGKTCLVATERDDVEEISRTFVHELGHFWGLEHRNNQPDNIMAQSGEGEPLVDSILEDAQIQTIQQTLARNLFRQGDRDA